ncbi:uncharacterized protein MELLADRAFT_88547 [Melampsora larici-populina 98AG31]|uniref:Uncharacterized protein n=1 Tax=Melampsora larici-populina (strain 98AG31 / pathotype 3-4-7) TaxID=747676 RepID=F4RS56_MELLP|nr:uncharacterized protein MELLADRAFT_88547 [Melampsora larici-populina 98AG31]EGG04837.1 hypothetical protein MELLADRAFT_88547 [Melampsora larici-populina 98AG31]
MMKHQKFFSACIPAKLKSTAIPFPAQCHHHIGKAPGWSSTPLTSKLPTATLQDYQPTLYRKKIPRTTVTPQSAQTRHQWNVVGIFSWRQGLHQSEAATSTTADKSGPHAIKCARANQGKTTAKHKKWRHVGCKLLYRKSIPTAEPPQNVLSTNQPDTPNQPPSYNRMTSPADLPTAKQPRVIPQCSQSLHQVGSTLPDDVFLAIERAQQAQVKALKRAKPPTNEGTVISLHLVTKEDQHIPFTPGLWPLWATDHPCCARPKMLLGPSGMTVSLSGTKRYKIGQRSALTQELQDVLEGWGWANQRCQLSQRQLKSQPSQSSKILMKTNLLATLPPKATLHPIGMGPLWIPSVFLTTWTTNAAPIPPRRQYHQSRHHLQQTSPPPQFPNLTQVYLPTKKISKTLPAHLR